MSEEKKDNIEVILISHTIDPEATVVSGIRQCYSPKSGAELKEKTTPEKRDRLIRQVIGSGHTSTIEHCSFTFSVSGVSRVTEIQLIRHRIASYSIKSGRYNKVHTNFVIPPKIAKSKEAEPIIENFKASLDKTIKDLEELGFKNEDSRYLTPQGTKTNIVVTMNARALLHFFEKRLCTRAQWEIRGLAQKMLDEVKEVAPTIFENAGPSCVSQKICWEGDMACDKWKTIEGAELKHGH